jgi:hypothetical protein
MEIDGIVGENGARSLSNILYYQPEGPLQHVFKVKSHLTFDWIGKHKPFCVKVLLDFPFIILNPKQRAKLAWLLSVPYPG